MKESHAISVRPCIIWSYPLFTQINRECFGPAVLILASSVVLTLGRCILTVSCTRLLGNPSNLFSCRFLSDFLGSPVPYILNFWACTIQSVITFSPMCISGQFRRFYSPVFSQPHSHACKCHSINIWWMSEQILRETQFPFRIPPCSGWKHDWVSCLAFSWVCIAFFQSQIEGMEKRFPSRSTLANLVPV